MRRSLGTDELPLSTRAAGRAYDLVVIGLGFWVLVTDADWIAWTFFVLGSLSGLMIFDNRVLSRGIPLTRPWQAVVIFLGISAILMWPFIWNVYHEHPVRGFLALAAFVATRLLFRRIPGSRTPDW